MEVGGATGAVPILDGPDDAVVAGGLRLGAAGGFLSGTPDSRAEKLTLLFLGLGATLLVLNNLLLMGIAAPLETIGFVESDDLASAGDSSSAAGLSSGGEASGLESAGDSGSGCGSAAGLSGGGDATLPLCFDAGIAAFFALPRRLLKKPFFDLRGAGGEGGGDGSRNEGGRGELGGDGGGEPNPNQPNKSPRDGSLLWEATAGQDTWSSS